ncbi:hypothetical protein [Streptomyces sp. NPDC049970]|uniref:hypothetical protein n=1 Tax=Streptomyces sp. NPDC049970 TaxID=3155033 RepID=UPI0034219AE3
MSPLVWRSGLGQADSLGGYLTELADTLERGQEAGAVTFNGRLFWEAPLPARPDCSADEPLPGPDEQLPELGLSYSPTDLLHVSHGFRGGCGVVAPGLLCLHTGDRDARPPGRVLRGNPDSGSFTSKITSASGRTLSFTNDGKHVTKVTDNTGRTVGYTYTGNLIKTFTDTDGQTTIFDYDTSNHLVKVTTAEGRQTKLTWDSDKVASLTRVVTNTTGAGNTTAFRWILPADNTNAEGVVQSLVDQRAASDAVHRKAEGRPHTGRIRAFRQRGEVP